MKASLRLCVIGDPIGHTLSPVIQNAMLEELGLPEGYEAVFVGRGKLGEWLGTAKARYAGFNATMPHKAALLPFMDTLSADAALFGAVNTVVVRNGALHGHNTDGEGFMRALREREMPFSRTAIIGAGGAARSVALKLASEGASVVVCCRSPEKAAALKGPRIEVAPLSELAARLSACDLLVNGTPLGMEGVSDQFSDFAFLDAMEQGTAVCDLIYRPFETLLLKEAGRRGKRVMNGLPMLVRQGICALELFLGRTLDVSRMKNAAMRALRADSL